MLSFSPAIQIYLYAEPIETLSCERDKLKKENDELNAYIKRILYGKRREKYINPDQKHVTLLSLARCLRREWLDTEPLDLGLPYGCKSMKRPDRSLT